MIYNRADLLMRCVISAISDDYEDSEITYREAKTCAESEGLTNVSEEEIADALERAIVEGYADAFEPFAGLSNPNAKNKFNRNRLGELCFYVTPKGKDAARAFMNWENPNKK